MRKYFFPNQDNTIYSKLPDRVSGLDEILEVGKSDTGYGVIRSLIQFDLSLISQSMVSGDMPIDTQFDLKLFLARAEKLKRGQDINVHLISSSWIEGSGYFYQDMEQDIDGATWKYTQSGSRWATSGSDFYTSSVATTQTPVPVQDFIIDVTPLVLQLVSGTIDNNGFVVKYPDADETDSLNRGRLYLFSSNTHTVHLPSLIAKWDDQTYSTGSLVSGSFANLMVYPYDLQPTYLRGEKVFVNVIARDKYPLKAFASTFTIGSDQYLPSSSYYSIVDVQTNEIIVPFDDNSKISVSTTGNYFEFWVDKMFPLRYYRVILKVSENGRDRIFDNNNTFSVRVS